MERADVSKRERAERGHDAWFRAEVQAALDDPRPGVAHDLVMEQARALVEEIAARKAGRED